MDEDQSSLLREGSPKWTRLFRDHASWVITPFLQMPDVFSSWLAYTFEEVAATTLTLDMSFVQNLSEGENTKIFYEVIHIIYGVSYQFFLVVVGRGDFLALGNFYK